MDVTRVERPPMLLYDLPDEPVTIQQLNGGLQCERGDPP